MRCASRSAASGFATSWSPHGWYGGARCGPGCPAKRSTVTIVAANIPSAFLAGLLMADGGLNGWFGEYLGTAVPAIFSTSLYELLHMLFAAMQAPAWVSGFLIDGVYLGLAWVVSVMLPPMAIFFPLFALLEDLGYPPRVAFNLDAIKIVGQRAGPLA